MHHEVISQCANLRGSDNENALILGLSFFRIFPLLRPRDWGEPRTGKSQEGNRGDHNHDHEAVRRDQFQPGAGNGGEMTLARV